MQDVGGRSMKEILIHVLIVLIFAISAEAQTGPSAKKPGALRVGIATVDITPEGPVYMRGFAARKKPSVGVYRNITATCVVFDNGATRLGFVAFDLCAIQEKQLDDLRAAAAHPAGEVHQA